MAKFFYGYRTNIEKANGEKISIFSKKKPLETDVAIIIETNEPTLIGTSMYPYEDIDTYEVILEYVCDDPSCGDPDCVKARTERTKLPELTSCSRCSK